MQLQTLRDDPHATQDVPGFPEYLLKLGEGKMQLEKIIQCSFHLRQNTHQLERYGRKCFPQHSINVL